MTGKDILPDKDLLEKAAATKRFECSSLRKKLNAQTDTARKQYQKLDVTYEFDKIIKKEKPTLENYSKLDLIYNSNYSFCKYYRNSKKLDNLTLESKYSFLVEFYTNVYNTASELYNDFLGSYFDEYYELWHAKKWNRP